MKMKAENISQFDRLPIEIQCKLFTYLSQDNLQTFRLVSKGCHSVVWKSRMCRFRSCTLSDATYKHVLSSNETVAEVQVQNLMAKIGISSTRGTVLAGISSLILGGSIHPYHLKKILETCGDLTKFGFDSIVHFCVDAFFVSNNHFDHVTKFSITARLQDGITTQNEVFFKKLAKCKRFPALKWFTVDWVNGHNISRRSDIPLKGKVGSLLYSIYISIHEILWNHRETVTAILWNLSGFWLEFSPNLSNISTRYMDIKNRIKDITLHKISINKFQNEGQACFDLSETMINSQRQVRILHLDHIMRSSHIVDDLLFRPIATPIQSNKLSLTELDIVTDLVLFFLFAGCDNLTKLKITTRLLILTGKVILKRVTHLSLVIEIKTVQSEIGYDPMNWIYEDLPELVELELCFSTSHSLPTARTFLRFFNPPKMQRLSFKFHATTPFNYQYIQRKFIDVVLFCGTTPGATIGWNLLSNTENSSTFELVCSVDRKIFTSFNI